ncbi:hypothetical protein BJV77DRAFT_254132 [Russula vinacea]|nr:hypothetical protein BJV77DRAFT_254132 [Russula vinacea]
MSSPSAHLNRTSSPTSGPIPAKNAAQASPNQILNSLGCGTRRGTRTHGCQIFLGQFAEYRTPSSAAGPCQLLLSNYSESVVASAPGASKQRMKPCREDRCACPLHSAHGDHHFNLHLERGSSPRFTMAPYSLSGSRLYLTYDPVMMQRYW